MTNSVSSTQSQLEQGKITEFLLEKAQGIIYLLRIAATNRDYIHDEIARCSNVQCLKQALYKLVRRYATLDGLKSALESISRSGMMTIPPKESNCRSVDEYAEKLHQRILSSLAVPNLSMVAPSKGAAKVEKGIEVLLAEAERVEASETDKRLFKDLTTTLAILGFVPGRFPYVKCSGGEK